MPGDNDNRGQNSDNTREWLRASADRMILLFVFLVQVAVVVWLTARHADEGSLDWARGGATLVLGWIGGMATGKITGRDKQ